MHPPLSLLRDSTLLMQSYKSNVETAGCSICPGRNWHILGLRLNWRVPPLAMADLTSPPGFGLEIKMRSWKALKFTFSSENPRKKFLRITFCSWSIWLYTADSYGWVFFSLKFNPIFWLCHTLITAQFRVYSMWHHIHDDTNQTFLAILGIYSCFVTGYALTEWIILAEWNRIKMP